MQAIKNRIPNILTIFRIALIPILVLSFYIDVLWHSWFAAIIFSLATATDFFDGYLARYWSVQSKFGAFLDPVADKIIVTASIMILVGAGHITKINLIPAMVIICRELTVSSLREFAAKQDKQIPVNLLSKIKTASQMGAIFILISGHNMGNSWKQFGNVLLWIAATISIFSGFQHLKKLLKSMHENKLENSKLNYQPTVTKIHAN